MGERIQIGYDKRDEPSLDDRVGELLDLEPDDLKAWLDKRSEEELLGFSTTLLELSRRDLAYNGDHPDRARQLLEIVVTVYRTKTGQI